MSYRGLYYILLSYNKRYDTGYHIFYIICESCKKYTDPIPSKPNTELSYILFCFLIQITDPAVESFGDALWFGLNVITTIGLGDYTVTTPLARILVVLLGLGGVLMFAFIPGVMTSYYLERVENKKDETLNQFYDQLVRAPELTDREKKAIAEKTRAIRKKVGK